MKNKDYWNVKEAKKIKFRESFLFFLIFCIILIFSLYLMRSQIFLVFLIELGGVIWYLYDFNKEQSRIISYPAVRIQDELLIYGYDQKIISWNHIYKVSWNPSKNRITLFYRTPTESRSNTLKSTYEKSDYIDVKWIKEKENLIHNVKSICEKQEIPFIVSNIKSWYHIWIIY